MSSHYYFVLILYLSHIIVSCSGFDAITTKSTLLEKLIKSTSQGDDCPGRSPLRHLCLPCKAVVHFWQSTIENEVIVRKSMIQTCSIVLHPHSFLCKAALEVFFLFMKHTSDERICQHLLICELNAHPQTMSSQVLNAHEDSVLQILRNKIVGNYNSTTGLSTKEKNDLIRRVADKLFTTTKTSHLEEVDKINLLSLFHRFLDAVDYHFSAKQS
ncbi:unnamed protein product [Cylicocyclus nassatus]|uniref:Uncharacterized protein n=1 Tax=Cylicocyclus nassatus TaxID=53992 RepID=A0AA36H5P5_CYLNA|nr:unnamed protein product [Cylicocyclus nassatus]